MGISKDISEVTMLQANKGKKIFRKKLRGICKSTSERFAQIHTHDEWKNFNTTETFQIEFHNLCPKKEFELEEKWIKPLYAFTIFYTKNATLFVE